MDETAKKSVTYLENDILIGFQLFIVPTVLVHPVLVFHASRLHLAFVLVEGYIGLGSCIVRLTGVGSEEGFDVCLSMCLVQWAYLLGATL